MTGPTQRCTNVGERVPRRDGAPTVRSPGARRVPDPFPVPLPVFNLPELGPPIAHALTAPHRHPADAPDVRVVERDDVLYTLDDRRRYASKQAGVEDIADPRSEL